jgi:septum formation protein
VTDAEFILASGSPRRRQLLELIGLPCVVHPSGIEELPLAHEPPRDFASRAARDKALDVARRYPSATVLGADTVVEIDGKILGKPFSSPDAERMLSQLSGREHHVHTALALVINGTRHELIDTAKVQLVHLSEAVIRWYVATGEPMGKAGAYAIQGLGGLLVAGVDGSPHTVVGLPIHRLPELFSAHGLEFWTVINRRHT